MEHSSYRPGFMPIADAMEIVYDLALKNALRWDLEKHDELYEEMQRQQTALSVVHDFIVNQLGDD